MHYINLFYIIIAINIIITNNINCTKIENPKKFMTDVNIDLFGNFKYILIEMTNKTNLNDYKYLVRGSTKFDYHKSLYRNFMQNSVYKFPEIFENFSFRIVGGGRISVYSNNITVYGSSGYYGTANHKLTCNLIKLAYPSYNCIAL